MSYITGPTFHGNVMGVRRLRSISPLAGFRGLGDAAQDTLVQQLTAAGFDPGDIQTLIVMGASDNDLANLLNGSATVGGLMNQLAGNYAAPITPVPMSAIPGLPSASPGPAAPSALTASVTPTTPVISPTVAPAPSMQSTSTPQSPAGSTFSFSASWPGVIALPTGVLQTLTAKLPGYGFQVINPQITGQGLLGSSSIQMTLFDTVGHATLAQAQSVPLGLLQQIVGNNVTSSMQLISQGSGSLASGAPAIVNPTVPSSFGAWMNSNWPWVMAGLVAVFILEELQIQK